jgi:hypothetical protein
MTRGPAWGPQPIAGWPSLSPHGGALTRYGFLPDYPRTGKSRLAIRYLLPKDLAGALERLDDIEVDTLLAAVNSEAKRRGRLPRGSASKTSAPSTTLGTQYNPSA